MADVAMLFHWTPQAMAPMDLSELMHWRHLAVERHNAMNAPEKTR
ncbi:MAG: GpE family phage tail protein [Acidovorax sp.]|nr:GpE family phage tail protein [Acidovorax sp.]